MATSAYTSLWVSDFISSGGGATRGVGLVARRVAPSQSPLAGFPAALMPRLTKYLCQNCARA